MQQDYLILYYHRILADMKDRKTTYIYHTSATYTAGEG